MTTELSPQSRVDATDDPTLPTDVAQLTTVLVNVLFVGRPGEYDWVLVDAGIPFQAARIQETARERFGQAPPKAILLTHGHFDHVGSLSALLRHWPDTPVYAHPLEMPYLTGQSSYPPPDPSVGGGALARLSFLFPRHPYDFRPNVRELPLDGQVPFLPDWRWVHTPGHTPGHVSFFRDSDKTVISGDAFISQQQESLTGVMTMARVLKGPPMYFTPDWDAARESVRRLADLGPHHAFTGHGLPVSNPRLAHDLGQLVRDFDRVSVPADGRYVRHPARSDERGTVWVPPPVDDMRPKIIGGLALAAGLLATMYAATRDKLRR